MATNKLSFLVCILLSMFGTKVLAYDIAVENSDGVTIYYFYINDGKELEVTFRETPGLGDYSNYSGSVVIPEEVTYINRTRKVTSIGMSAFWGCYDLTSITIPNSVTSIGSTAFTGCNRLTSITIPNSVTSIDSYAFDACSGLTSVTIPNSITVINMGVFSRCTGLTSVTIPNSVTSIGQYAFTECSGLTSITIPNSVTSILTSTFQNCSSLTSITIPNSVTSIGQYAFSECSCLTSVTIPNSITNIGEEAFSGCELLEVISKIENPFDIDANTFSKNTFLNATLYVPAGTINKYKATEGWKKFAFIEEGTGGDTPGLQKCATPIIGYKNGKLTFRCETEGATCQYSIIDTDIKSGSGNEVQLGVTYTINVYATKADYENSETATATLCWIDVEPRTEGIVNDIANVRAMPVMIQNDGGQLTINGADDNTSITVYDLNGVQVGSAISNNGVAYVNTNLSRESIAIVKIGDKSVKVIIK